MKPSRILFTALLIVMILFSSALPGMPDEDFIVGEMKMDRLQWGMRQLAIPISNPRQDTAYVRVTTYTFYMDHYLSGMDNIATDTSFIVFPANIDTHTVHLEWPASFGRIVTRVHLYWRFNNPDSGQIAADSMSMSFSSVIRSGGDAALYEGVKHCIGPAWSVMDYPVMNYELPRLMLFLLSREVELNKIATILRVERRYNDRVFQQLTGEKFFPIPESTTSPGILGITESEAYVLRNRTNRALELFTAWYDDKGKNKLDKIIGKSGLDDGAAIMPSLRMVILLSLLREPLIDLPQGYDIFRFEDKRADLANLNRPAWIVQGGEFFMPRLCIAAADDDGSLRLSTYLPGPRLKFDKEAIIEMIAAVDSASGSIPRVKASTVAKIIRQAREDNLVEELAEELQPLIDDARFDIEHIKDYQEKYLAEYFFRIVLGAYFAKNRPSGITVDCIKVVYQ